MGERAAGGGPAALPSLNEFEAPRAWHCIDFIADLHLNESMPATFEAFAAHLQHTPADAIFILGDLFEVWVGDDAATRPFERHCLETLAAAASHRHIGFMVGNRDFLASCGVLGTTGMMGLPDPTVLGAWGRRLLLSHGDALCLDDAPYQAFRAEVRSDAWQAQFLARPLAERLRIAAEIRRVSSERQRFEGMAGADVDAGEAVRWLHALGAAELVHGHTHRPGSSLLAPGFKRHVLSDWDLDHGQRAEVLRLTRDRLERVAPAAA
ncbi:UDP-2,3-diacylglucosamine pyrophosphatase [Rubrivivax sp. A210]|uniref:UDP-2,3-diacylglucosamine diphosphatase n=1 Tax=Rubrivivax sp. A210 TaxID=2772301 RepID=UPI00191AB93E|nr:UDP-2,3-diacylglucosamine diphosphatase [Rubrivivax sp. A210]CAD5366140.1 UDP-2,3-diacylglucosamine pyrophosphatase [Rubrivivax sp. A210]